jgi:fermentation-respiration switch protein FrsA (DUF1100 family)
MLKKVSYSIGTLLLALIAGVIFFARVQALDLIENPIEERRPLSRTPAEFTTDYEDITVITEDGFTLHGWFIPSRNGAVVIAQHGYKNSRSSMMDDAEILSRHGYGVLVSSVRAHDLNDGELISFGHREMADFAAWFDWLEARDDVDTSRTGLLGQSMGGSLVIQYAAENPAIKAVVSHSAFSSIPDTIETSVTAFTGLPPFPFAPLIQFWAEQKLDVRMETISARDWISDISPRAIFILHGGSDTIVSPESGELLYRAAGEPKELWFEPELGHSSFNREFPEEYEQRIIEFFDEYL